MAEYSVNPVNIAVDNVQVRYTVGTNDPTYRSRGIKHVADRLLGRQGHTTVRALRGVSLVAREGEMLGVVGANGSGKSTLLRNIAGVEQPDRGRILVRFQPLLLGVNAALQPSLSGSENVRLGCLAMGMTPAEADEAYGHVVDLSALGEAIHRPMGTFSSGMGSRLRFAIALAARPKILLIDEALSTGDASFAERSERAMSSLLAEAGTVVLVNHAAKVIQDLCTRAVWMHKGEILMDGPAEAVAERYRWWAWNVAKGEISVSDKLLHDVVKNASQDEINILESEFIKNPMPRHANRRAGEKKTTRARIADRDSRDSTKRPSLDISPVGSVNELADRNDAPLGSDGFPVLPKPANGVRSAQQITNPPPLRSKSRRRPIVLRAADPNDRASSVASGDLTVRRLASSEVRSSNRAHAVGEVLNGRSTRSSTSGRGEADHPGELE